MYGHATVLRGYCSRKFVTPIPGLVQHGWSFGPGIASANFQHFTDNPTHRAFVWNRRNAADCRDLGLNRVRIIGAPLLYLPRDPVPPTKPKPGSLLLFPSHSCEWEPYAARADEIYETYFDQLEPVLNTFSSTTVCLYWREYEIEALRKLIRQRGFRVTTLGHRDGNPNFLSNFRSLALAHEYVSSNSFSTALFYSLFLKRKTFVCGTTFVNRLQPGRVDSITMHEAMGRRYPQLDWERFDNSCHEDIGAEELGAELKLNSDELRHEFGWFSSQIFGAVVLRVVSGACRRLGLSRRTSRNESILKRVQ